MKTFLIITILTLLISVSSCQPEANPNIHYINYKVKIVEKGGFAERNGKYTHTGKYFLVQSLEDTTLFTELNGYNFSPLGTYYGSQLYWSHEVGDVLTFDYVRKDRFWKKENKTVKEK